MTNTPPPSSPLRHDLRNIGGRARSPAKVGPAKKTGSKNPPSEQHIPTLTPYDLNIASSSSHEGSPPPPESPIVKFIAEQKETNEYNQVMITQMIELMKSLRTQSSDHPQPIIEVPISPQNRLSSVPDSNIGSLNHSEAKRSPRLPDVTKLSSHKQDVVKYKD
jgi:hypothetical protein